MRVGGVIRYNYIRYGKGLLAALITVVILTVGSNIALRFIQAENMRIEMQANGSYGAVASFDAMRIYSNPASFEWVGVFSWMILWMSCTLTGRDRKFLVTLSVSRYEILLGNFLFMLSLAVMATVLAWLIPLINRLALLAVGFRFQNNLSTQTLILGNSARFLFDGVMLFSDFVLIIGAFTFLGYLFGRWWKQLLVIMGAGLVIFIVVMSQLALGNFSKEIVDGIIWFADYAVSHIAPAIEQLFEWRESYQMILLQLGLGVGLTALSYPVLYKFKIK
jgi:hypothetical protein